MEVETGNTAAGSRLEEHLTLPLLEATRAAALAAQPWFGRGDGKAADGAAVDAMRRVLNAAPGEGVVVIGEGEKDDAPMLYNGEVVGAGGEPRYEIAVDPLEGTRYMAKGLPGAVSVISVAERGSMWSPGPGFYMDKLVVGADARGAVDIRLPPEENLERVAEALGKEISDVHVFVLDKDRHEEFVARIRRVGAAVVEYPDGDVAGALEALIPGGGVDVLMGVGGTPEGVIAASAAQILGGDMQGRLAPQNAGERQALEEAGFDVGQVFTVQDLVRGEALFVATGASGGHFLKRPWRGNGREWTESLVLRPGGRITRVLEGTGENTQTASQQR
jgi:fructose-1,6-bisphosphatase II